jgi:thiopeptide-type bacteriocin biosynthesis protein
VDRYGGPQAVEFAESYFEADSRAVLAMLRNIVGDRDADARWRLALLGVDMLMGDFGLDVKQKSQVVAALRGALWTELRGGKPLTVRMGDRFRAEAKQLAALLDPSSSPDGVLLGGRQVLERRREESVSIVEQFVDLERRGRLTRPLVDIVSSLVHMHMNRMLRSAARAHELVVYDFLGRLYASALATSHRAHAHREA